MNPSQEVVQRTPQQELVARIRTQEFQSQVAIALPENVKPERFVRAAATALLDNPDLAGAEPNSVFAALLKSAQDGLLPDGREAALVIFKGKAAYLPMIGGFRKIAADHGWSIRTQVVYANDLFEHEEGLDPHFRHVPVRPGTDRGDPIAAYAVGAHADGRRELEVMRVDEIEKVRNVSRAKDKGPWVDWWERMAEKTVGKRLFAKLPLGDLDERVARVLEASAIEPGDAAALMYGPKAGEILNPSTGEITSAATSEDGGPTEAADRQVEGEDRAPPSSSSTPDDDDYVPEGEQQSFAGPAEAQALQAKAEEAGKVVVPSNRPEFKDKTIAEVAALGSEGEKYLRWILHPERGWAERDDRKAVLEATRVFVEIMLPDLWSSTREAA